MFPQSIKISRITIFIQGAVQGVGFRPFIFHLASEMNVKGWVKNSPQGVTVDAEAPKRVLEEFIKRIDSERPAHAFIYSLEYGFYDPVFYEDFEILPSDQEGEKTALVLPDIAICQECLKEIIDPQNRRYRYPFTNCTHCGPRYSIIEKLPYDRSNTSMKDFRMCPQCAQEYHLSENRRFHAQPNACPSCGPQLALWDRKGKVVEVRDAALTETVKAVKEGKIVAVKGLGGFHLLVDATNAQAVQTLRERKNREGKPLAVMFPNLEMLKEYVFVSPMEEQLLSSPQMPIVLLRKREKKTNLADGVAPNNPYLGVMLPYTPLHYLLLMDLGMPVVATSGNISDEPICTDEKEALERLGKIADLFLVHDRPIVRHVDDSVVRLMGGRPMVLRRARGYAPLPLKVSESHDAAVLAVGAHLKNTIAIARANNIFISQHIGDLETEESFRAFKKTIDSFQNLFSVKPLRIVHDKHPDYLSSQFANKLSIPKLAIQHHYAHIVSCMVENNLRDEVLGIAWDGTGMGDDGTIWGGEFLKVGSSGYQRIGYFRPFPLPGGDKAIKEPRRTALGILFSLYGKNMSIKDNLPPFLSYKNEELQIITQMLEKGMHSPLTSSVGRLFDGVAALLGLYQFIRFEGEAAMALEFLAEQISVAEYYNYDIVETDSESYIVDWHPLLANILTDCRKKKPKAFMAKKFHNTLVQIIVDMAKRVNIPNVVLSGGCFQNRILTEQSIKALTKAEFHPYWHQRIPPNDGGICLGQVVAAAQKKEN